MNEGGYERRTADLEQAQLRYPTLRAQQVSQPSDTERDTATENPSATTPRRWICRVGCRCGFEVGMHAGEGTSPRLVGAWCANSWRPKRLLVTTTIPTLRYTPEALLETTLRLSRREGMAIGCGSAKVCEFLGSVSQEWAVTELCLRRLRYASSVVVFWTIWVLLLQLFGRGKGACNVLGQACTLSSILHRRRVAMRMAL